MSAAAIPARRGGDPELRDWFPEVTVTASGLEARLALTHEDGDGDGEAPRPTVQGLRRALARAGVVHGIDGNALAQLAAQPAGPPRVVARGTAATRGTDGVVVLDFLHDTERDPLHTVPAGTLLARKSLPTPGTPGTSVLGEPIEPPAVRDPALEAGAGTVALPGAAGLRVCAAVDGRPVHRGGVVAVEEVITLASMGVERRGADVLCSLRVIDFISEAHRVAARGDLTVGGMVDRSRLEAGTGLSVGAGCVFSHLRAGGLDPLRLALLERLRAVEARMRALRFEAERLIARAATRGHRLAPGRALLALAEGPFADVVRALGECRAIAHEASGDGLHGDVVAAVEAAHAALAGLGPHDIGSLETLGALSAGLTAQVRAMGDRLSAPADLRVNYLQRCRAEVSGSLEVTGRGVFNSSVRVVGDFTCTHPAGTIRGGRLHVGGVLRTPELGGPGAAPVEVILEGGGLAPERLVAGTVHAGVKVCLGGSWQVFTESRHDVRLGIVEAGQPTLHLEGAR